MKIDPYTDGLEAAYRTGRYEGVKFVPECPYPDGSPASGFWWDGFGDGTEDLIFYQTAEI